MRTSGSRAGRQCFALKSTMDSVSQVEIAAEKLAIEAGLNEDERFGVLMAVHEATVNAILHGNEYRVDKQIHVCLENDGHSLIFVIADQGKGLDPDKIQDPRTPENLLRGAGRGIFLIRSYMDEVKFRKMQPGTELTMVKHLNQ